MSAERCGAMSPVSPSVVAPLSSLSHRPWTGFHRLPQSCDADALVPTLGHTLLRHAPRAGAGQPGAVRAAGWGWDRVTHPLLSPALSRSLSVWRVSSRASWTCSPSQGPARCAARSPPHSAVSSAASSTSPWSHRWGMRQGHGPHAGHPHLTPGCPLPRGSGVGWGLHGTGVPMAGGAVGAQGAHSTWAVHAGGAPGLCQCGGVCASTAPVTSTVPAGWHVRVPAL